MIRASNLQINIAFLWIWFENQKRYSKPPTTTPLSHASKTQPHQQRHGEEVLWCGMGMTNQTPKKGSALQGTGMHTFTTEHKYTNKHINQEKTKKREKLSHARLKTPAWQLSSDTAASHVSKPHSRWLGTIPLKQPPTHSRTTSQPLSIRSTWLHAINAQGSTLLGLIPYTASRSLDEELRAPGPLVLSSLWCPEWVSRHSYVEGMEKVQRRLLLSVDTRLFCRVTTVWPKAAECWEPRLAWRLLYTWLCVKAYE